MQVSAAGLAQKISLSRSNAALKTVLRDIRIQSGYVFLYNEAQIRNAKPVSIKVDNADFKDVLRQIFSEQPLTYSINEKTITVKERPSSLLDRVISAFARVDVRGRIVDKDGNGIPGVTILVKGTSRSTNTSNTGGFSLNDLPEGSVLIIRSVGYNTKEVEARPELGEIVLEMSDSKLDEVMVIGYGATTRRLSTGSTGQVTGEEITRQPVSNPILALQGRVPGLFITQNAGFSGANVSVVIRGQNSLTFNSAAPLYVIDGVPFTSSPVERSAGGFFGVGVGFSPLNTINPSEIESIDVLKDADATAIYGSRGANGVILITTKKGKKQDTRFDLELSSGFGSITNSIPMLSTQQYLDIRRQAFLNDGITPTPENAPDLTLWDQNGYTDFPDLLIGKTSHQTNAALSISGGDDYTQFVLGGNYRKESVVFYSKSADKAVQSRLSVQHKSRNNKFSSTASVSYNIDNNTIPSFNMTLANYALPPNYPVYNTDGTLYFGPGYDSPLAPFNATTNLKSANLNASAGLSYKLLPGLDLKATGGYNLIDVEGSNITPASASNPANNFFQLAVLNHNYVKTYIVEPQINYEHKIGKGTLNALLGGTWQQTQTVQPYFLLATFTNLQLVNSLSALNILAKSSGYKDYRYASGFARLEYNWDNKYLLSANIRRDGSSRFGESNRYGNFGSAAAAWIFSKESFIADNLPWLSFGKLRASYGTIGNDKIPDYEYQSGYDTGTEYGIETTLIPGRIANPYLKWEQTKKLDLALETGFLKDRILFSANFYRNRSSNLLGTTPLPVQTGFEAYTTNLPATVQNHGLELELSTVNYRNSNFSWNTSFNFTAPRNKLLAFDDLQNSSYANMYVVGESLNLRTIFRSGGIIDGIATAVDVNGDGVISEGINANGNGDYIVFGSADPDFYGGINNTLTYKGLQLDFLFQLIKRDDTRGDLNFATAPGQGFNIPESLLDVGLKYTSTYGTPAADSFYYFTNSDAAVEDASFVRLKNISLAYSVPQSWTKRVRISGLQLFARGQNLLTFTKYKGLDPETLTTQVPPLKMFIAGFKATF